MTDKIDVIVSVDGDASILKMSIYSLIKNSGEKFINNIFIINNFKTDKSILNCINNLKNKYDYIIYNEKNSYESVLKRIKCKYIAFISSNCIVSENSLVKLKNHLSEDTSNIVAPVSNRFFDIPNNYTYCQVNELCENKCKNDYICTDELYSDFLVVEKNKAVNLIEFGDYKKIYLKNNNNINYYIDTYVYYKFEANSCHKSKISNKISNIIFSKINFVDNKPKFRFLTYLISIVQDSGGIHVAIDMVNYLLMNGYNCNILYNNYYNYDELMLFKPIHVTELKKCQTDAIMSTIYFSTYYAREIANLNNIPLIYFAQGYEPYFNNATEYASAELSYKIADEVLCVSKYLKNIYKRNFNIDSFCITNGVNLDLLFYDQNVKKKIETISMCLRGSDLKGDFILMDVIKKITNNFNNISLNVICNNRNIQLPINYNDSVIINRVDGPLKREEIAKILQSTDIYIDGSLTEGFGLMSLEAMAAGAVVIASNSGGNLEYLKNGYNGLVVDKINNPDEYIRLINYLINNINIYNKYRVNSMNTVKKYDFDNVIDKYIQYFSMQKTKKNIELSDNEYRIYNRVLESKFKTVNSNSMKGRIFKFKKFIPKKLKNIIRKIINKLHSMVNYE